MRGKRIRKIIQRMPSGRFRWNVIGMGDECLASGFAPSKAIARQESYSAELKSLGAIQRAEKHVSTMKRWGRLEFGKRAET